MGKGYTLGGVGADLSAPTEGQVISRIFVISFKIWTVIYFHLPNVISERIQMSMFEHLLLSPWRVNTACMINLNLGALK